MTKKDNDKIFFDGIYSKPPKTNFDSGKLLYNHIDEIWSFDLADMNDYKISNNEGYRYIFVITDYLSNFLLCIPLNNKNAQTTINGFSNTPTPSKRITLELESDRGAEIYNSTLQNFLKVKNIQQYSRFTDKRPSITERVRRTRRNLLKKPIFSAGNADWLSDLPLADKTCSNTIHNSRKRLLLKLPKIQTKN